MVGTTKEKQTMYNKAISKGDKGNTKFVLKNCSTAICTSEGPFKMDRYEAAKFMEKNEYKILRLLRGKYEDKCDAISQVKMKILEIAIENGEVLRFTKDQFKEARTEKEWISFLASHARARLSIVKNQRDFWYDSEIMSSFGLRADCDEMDDVSEEEDRMYVSAIEHGEDSVVAGGEGESVGEAEDVERAPVKASALVKWQMEQRKKHRRVLGAISFYQELHSGPKTHSIDREWIREEVRAEVVRIAKEADFSDRDIQVYCLGVFGEYTAKEVLVKIPTVCSTSNVDKIKSLIKTAIEEAAYKPGSKLAFLYAA